MLNQKFNSGQKSVKKSSIKQSNNNLNSQHKKTLTIATNNPPVHCKNRSLNIPSSNKKYYSNKIVPEALAFPQALAFDYSTQMISKEKELIVTKSFDKIYKKEPTPKKKSLTKNEKSLVTSTDDKTTTRSNKHMHRKNPSENISSKNTSFIKRSQNNISSSSIISKPVVLNQKHYGSILTYNELKKLYNQQKSPSYPNNYFNSTSIPVSRFPEIPKYIKSCCEVNRFNKNSDNQTPVDNKRNTKQYNNNNLNNHNNSFSSEKQTNSIYNPSLISHPTGKSDIVVEDLRKFSIMDIPYNMQKQDLYIEKKTSLDYLNNRKTGFIKEQLKQFKSSKEKAVFLLVMNK